VVVVVVEFDDVLVEFELSQGGSGGAGGAVLLAPAVALPDMILVSLLAIVALPDMIMVPLLAIVALPDMIMVPLLAMQAGGGGGAVALTPAGGVRVELPSAGGAGGAVALALGGVMIEFPADEPIAVLDLTFVGAARAPCPRRTVKRKTELIFDSILMHLLLSLKVEEGPAL